MGMGWMTIKRAPCCETRTFKISDRLTCKLKVSFAR